MTEQPRRRPHYKAAWAIIAKPSKGPEYVADTFERESTARAVCAKRYGPRSYVVNRNTWPHPLNYRKPARPYALVTS